MSVLASAIERLRDAFPKQPFGDRAVVVYAEQLADLDENEVFDAVCRLIDTEARCPTISEIRREVVEETLGLPTSEEAWDLACGYAMAQGEGRAQVAPPCEEVRAALRAVGGPWGIRTCQNPTTLYAQFRKTYEGYRERAVKKAAVGSPIRQEQLRAGRAGPVLPPAVTSLAGRKLAALPESTSIRARGSGVRPAPLE